MFDAKSLIEMMVKGAAPAAQSGGGLGGLADILGKMMQGQGGAQSGQRNVAPGQQGQGGGMGLEDLLRQLQGMGGGQQGGQQGGQGGGGFADAFRNMLPGGQGQPAPQGQQPGPGGSGGLGDILGRLQEQLGQAGRSGGAGQPGAGQGQGGGGLMDILGQVLGQATSGVKEGAQRIDNATGVGRHARDAVGQATGRSPEELLEQLKDWVSRNPGTAAAGAGGLGAVVLGTRAGRSLAGSAAKLGALVMIGGLAYKAWQNYSSGRPMISGPNFVPEQAPQGSGFEPQAVTQESAAMYIRAMIAAAAADGRIDEAEQHKILGGLKQAGVDAEAEEFIANELNNPATVEDLVAGVQTQEEAVQLFTAARIAVDLDTQQEHDFLVALAQGLQLDAKLVQHIDAAARGAAA
jgi:uncharacterized membrane protein YebE (DUF533 family)